MTLPNGKKGVYDYYIRDYQENVRMILTEETHTSLNKGTMETGRAANEEPVFGQPGAGNEVATTRFPISSIPGQSTGGGWQSNTSSSVSKLSKLSGHTIGPNSLLKVMAGDTLNASADYYYPTPVSNNSNSLVADVVNNLVMAISGSAATSSTVKGATSGISTNLNGSVPFANAADPDKTTTDNIPRAYLNIMFFDERFNFVAENSTAVRVSQSGNGAAPLVLPANTKAPKNGYAYIYVSNENDDAVYFDNLQVSDKRGRIIEENHYYDFGLKIAAISSIKLPDANEGNINNKNLYNDKELIDEADLNWYDYGFRNYDPQIGRFPQLDPLTDDYPELTNYQYASNDPIANIDLDGLEGVYYVTVKTVVKHTSQAASVGSGIGKGLSLASIGVSVGKIASNVANKIFEQAGIVKWNASNRYDKLKEFAKEKIENARNNLQPGSVFREWLGGVIKDGLDPMQASLGAPIGLEIKEMEALYEVSQVGKKVEMVSDVAKMAKNGSTIANQLGQDLHKLYKAHLHNPSKGMYKEYTGLLKKYGIKPDFVDFNTRTIYDLKPNNIKKMRQYTKQLENYKEIFEKEFGGTWNTVMDKY